MKRFGHSNEQDDLSVSCENLNRLDGRQSVLFDSRKALIRELAYSICRGGEASADEIRNNYFSVFSSDDERGKYFSAISAVERIELCLEIASLIGKENPFYRSVFGPDEVCLPKAKEKISYVKNKFTDSAYLSFTKRLHSPRCSYSDSFETICEDVFNGESEFCILPIETSTDGRLFSFYSLIDRYELKTSAICSVEHQGGTAFTRFALLKRSLSDRDVDNITSESNAALELKISLSSSDSPSMYNIFRAADACGMPLLRTDSLSLPYGDSLISNYAVFGIDKTNLQGFLTYISLEFPQCYASGLYPRES